VVRVIDSGPGPEDQGVPLEGVGLRNTRERLSTLYPGRVSLELSRTPEGGAGVTVRLPYREAERRHA